MGSGQAFNLTFEPDSVSGGGGFLGFGEGFFSKNSTNIGIASAGIGNLAAAGLSFAELGAGSSEFAQNQLIANAQFSQIAATEAVKRGNRIANLLRKKGKKLLGTQRSTFAAQGVVVDQDTPQDVAEDTARVISEDAIEIQNNAWLQAFGFNVQAIQFSTAAEFERISEDFRKKAGLVSGIAGSVSAATNSFSSFSGGFQT